MAEELEDEEVKSEKDWAPDAQLEQQALDEDIESLVEIVENQEDKLLIADEDTTEEKEVREVKKKDRFQRRIDKLTAQRKSESQRADASEAHALNLEQRMGALEENSGRQSVENFQQRYDAVRNQLLEATESGDTSRQVELQEHMADMRATVRIAEAQKRGVSQQQPLNQQNQDAPVEAYKWWDKNKWFNDPSHKAESAYARVLDDELDAEGFDQDDPEYYEELDSRLQSKFPELYKKEGSKVDNEKENPKPKPKPPTAPTGGQPRGGGQPNDGRVRLTREELNVARELGLTTKTELTEYVKELSKQKLEEAS